MLTLLCCCRGKAIEHVSGRGPCVPSSVAPGLPCARQLTPTRLIPIYYFALINNWAPKSKSLWPRHLQINGVSAPLRHVIGGSFIASKISLMAEWRGHMMIVDDSDFDIFLCSLWAMKKLDKKVDKNVYIFN